MVTATKTAKAYRVLHRRRSGTSYGSWLDEGTFVPLSVHEAVAPGVASAKVALNIPALTCDPWEWGRYFATDDQIAIVDDAADPANVDVLFCGFVVDVDLNWGAADENAIVTAVGYAHRLRADVPCVGRLMKSSGGEPFWYSGQRLSFNEGGKPNRHATARTSGTVNGIGFPPGPSGAVPIPLFTWDGDPAAEYWTAEQALYYLLWTFNGEQEYVANPNPANLSLDAAGAPVVVDVEGMDLWTALAEVAARAGWDVCELYTNAGGGTPMCAVQALRRHTGTEKTVMRQDRTDPLGRVDLDRTNVFAASIAVATASCVARPLVAGGTLLVEATIPLQQAWDPAKLAIPGDDAANILLPGEGAAARVAKALFFDKYHTKGDDFADYAEAGRLWDANCDGKYSSGVYQLTQPDMAALCGYTAGQWPVMPYPARPMLTKLDDSLTTQDCFLEVSVDAGSNWYPMIGFRVVRKRLAIYLDAANLGSYIIPGGVATRPEDTLFYYLAETPANVKMRITCTVAAPVRAWHYTPRAAGAGTAFDTCRHYDRGTAGQVRTVAAASRFAGATLPQDTATGGTELEAIGAGLRDQLADRLIEASLPVEWPDEPLYLTDQIIRIDGIGLELGTNAGAVTRYPRIVGKDTFLTPETYSMTVQLDTDRKAGIV